MRENVNVSHLHYMKKIPLVLTNINDSYIILGTEYKLDTLMILAHTCFQTRDHRWLMYCSLNKQSAGFFFFIE